MLAQKQQHEGNRRLVTIFVIGGMRFGVEVDYLVEIQQVKNEVLHEKKGNFYGFFDSKGRKIPILNFQKFCNIASDNKDANIRSMLILRDKPKGDDSTSLLGIVVDLIEGVEDEKNFNMFAFPQTMRNEATDIYQGLLVRRDNLISQLDIPRLINKVKNFI